MLNLLKVLVTLFFIVFSAMVFAIKPVPLQNAEGIAIIFNTYQVAAYVYGEKTVSIPLSAISPLLQPAIAHTVWNH